MSLLKGTRITWLGHSTVLIQTAQGTTILIDPFIEHNPKYPKGYKLPEKIDYVLLTHGHGDHISDAVPVATKHGSTVAAIVELAGYIESKGVKNTVGFNIGGTIQCKEVAVSMVEATHTSSAQDEKGIHNVGVPAGFVLTIADGPVLYHAGDTSVFGDMKLIAELYHPEVAMIPIGGFYTMGPKEAALAVKFLQPKMVLPLHFGTFPPLTGTPKELAALIDPKIEVIERAPGETIA
jgi:L-ascorbate metabolism protein UlaG (beta-lactamase superfamily)